MTDNSVALVTPNARIKALTEAHSQAKNLLAFLTSDGSFPKYEVAITDVTHILEDKLKDALLWRHNIEVGL